MTMGRSYACVLSFDPERLARHQISECDALAAVRSAFVERGFAEMVPGLYEGPDGIGAVRAVVVIQEISEGFAWFTPCLKSARLLRIEEDGDLTIALI